MERGAQLEKGLSSSDVAAPNRNQHWVPQFYLRYFATPESRDTHHPKIWAFPVQEGEEFCTTTRNVAAQRDLYAFCAPKGDKKLSDLEGMLGKFWPTLTQPRYPLDLGFRRGISLFIATLYLRHPEQLSRQRRFSASLAKALESGPRDPNGRTTVGGVIIEDKDYDVDPDELDRWRTATDNDIRAAWGDLILSDSAVLAQRLIDLPWAALVTDEPAFITTDHPVALHNSTRDDAPILHPDTRIYFPLSPTKLVFINTRKENDGKAVLIPKHKAAVFNYCVFRAAYQHVFSAWDSIYVLDQICRFGDWARAEQQRMTQKSFDSLGVKIGRNELCYCGSGMKYKRCCGR